ncbi:MAG: TIM barrel protein [Anaerolineae bacterium]
MQFHDDDAVPGLDDLTPEQVVARARDVRRTLENNGLVAEFVAPRLWEHPLTVDGGFTANDPQARAYAADRARRAVDIAHELGTDLLVLWLAREGTYMREAKDIVLATQRLVEALDALLSYDSGLRIAIEPKPNEPMDLAYVPTMGHALALGYQTQYPARMGVLMESAHSVLAGLDPSDEIGYALAFGKLWSVHLNDQGGLKFDEDRAFGSVDIRRAFNQVRVLDENLYYRVGMVGLDVKAIRTQPDALATKHLRNSLRMFLRLVELSRSLDRDRVEALRAERDYEELEWLILDHLMAEG